MLGTRQLLEFYLFLSSFGVLFWSYISNRELVEMATALTDQNTSVIYECSTLNTDILIKVSSRAIKFALEIRNSRSDSSLDLCE